MQLKLIQSLVGWTSSGKWLTISQKASENTVKISFHLLSLRNFHKHTQTQFSQPPNRIFEACRSAISNTDSQNTYLIYLFCCKSAVRMGPKLTETMKGKLSLGARILRVGGVEKVFKQKFSVREGDKLLKASQCYLSTTAGPIAGLLFISTDKLAFCSERSIKLSTPTGEFLRYHYKVIL